MNLRSLALGIGALTLSVGLAVAGAPAKAPAGVGHVEKPDVEWKKILTPDQYRVLRQKGTEMAFTGKYWNNHASGTYVCAACGL
jgi:peptide-methionine (R)-S-oxide reductase